MQPHRHRLALAALGPEGSCDPLRTTFRCAEFVRHPPVRGFPSAPERTRTSTDHKVHKALNLARLPIPPQALEAASIAPRGFPEGILLGRPRVPG
jgi:hypothetical protein